MTEKVWCKREKKFESAMEKVVIGVLALICAAVVGFFLYSTIGYLAGYIPVPTDVNDNMLFATCMTTAMTIIFSVIGAGLITESPFSKGDVLPAYALFIVPPLLSTIAIADEFVRFSSLIYGYIGIIIMAPMLAWIFFRIMCKKEELNAVFQPVFKPEDSQ